MYSFILLLEQAAVDISILAWVVKCGCLVGPIGGLGAAASAVGLLPMCVPVAPSMSLVGLGLDSVPLMLPLGSHVKPLGLLGFLPESRVALLFLSETLRVGREGSAFSLAWMLRPLTFRSSQTTSATMAPAPITGGWPVPPSQATSVSPGLCSTPTAIACPARNSQSWEEATPIAGTPGARWKAPGALRRIKTYAWNCVTYPRVVCILSIYTYIYLNVYC